jgi:hypothetical protein
MFILSGEDSLFGNIISGEGIVVDPTKVEAIMEWPALTNVQEVCSFMGLAGYYRCFVEGFSKIENPITNCKRRIINLYGYKNALKHLRILNNYYQQH